MSNHCLWAKPDAEPDDPAAKHLKSSLEAFASEHLNPFCARIRERKVRFEQKVINDAVWGSVRLHPWEVAVLDSPLMQRLRNLKQLGVIHWVYPTANHSRLEHSIGVLHQAQALMEGLERNSGKAGEELVSDVETKLMRLAALLHDCGHTVMSHVSEPVVKHLPGVAQLCTWLHGLYGCRERPSASEAFAAIFIRSKAFRDLLREPGAQADFIKDPADACSKIAGLLLCAPVFDEKPYLPLLINGPLDADKLDYMRRDSLMAGIPHVLDSNRLVEKIHCVSVPHSERVEDFATFRAWARISSKVDLRVLALPRSASGLLHEMATARRALFEKVYQHQKVRAIELMVRRTLNDGADRSIADWLRISDDDLLATGMADSLRLRQLLKRAFYIAPPPDQPEANAGWRGMRIGDIEHKILTAAYDAARILGTSLDELDRSRPAVDFPEQHRVVLPPTWVGDTFHELELVTPTSQSQTRGGYVYAAESQLISVYFGCQRVLAEEYAQTIGPETFARTKLDPEDLGLAYDRLHAANFFKKPVTQPDSNLYKGRARSQRSIQLEYFLKNAWPRIQDLSVRLGQYQTYRSQPVSPKRIAEFLRQFETAGRARTMLTVLENIDFKGRQFFSDSLGALIKQHERDGEIGTVCPLGGTGDSSTTISYIMNDLPPGLRKPVVQLEIALDDQPGRILLWDDFCGAAGHAKTVIAQWLGIRSRAVGILDESLARPLSPKRQKLFRKTQIVIGFSIARESGVNELRSFLHQHDITNVEVVCANVASESDGVFSDESAMLVDPEARRDLKAFLEKRMGDELRPKTRRKNRRWSQDKLASRLLGYGNSASLMVFSYNVPTVSLTALWLDGKTWVPLLPRREKPSI